MGQLEDAMKEAENDNLGKKVADDAKKTAKKEAKKGAEKLAKTAAKKAGQGAVSALGKTKAGAAAINGAKALIGAAKAFTAFLASPPWGWIVGAILIVGGVILLGTLSESGAFDFKTDAGITIVDENGELTDEGVILIEPDCPETDAVESLELAEMDGPVKMRENAQLVYSVFKSYGLNDASIAGILGNLQAEGGIDPTCVEGIYSEPYQMGPKSTAAFNDLDTYTRTTLSAAYAKNGTDYTQNSGYNGGDGKKYPGLGLVQWTGPGAKHFLEIAESTGNQWWSLEFQLAYMLCDVQYRPGFFAKWKELPSTTAPEGAFYFAKWYEGNTILAQDARRNNASNWYSEMGSWSINEGYAASIVALANTMGTVVETGGLVDSYQECDDSTSLSNDFLLTTGELNWPAVGFMSSPFGPRWGTIHKGIDIANSAGTPIWAAADGTVTYSQWNGGGYGYQVRIDHGGGVFTTYAHNSSLIAVAGQTVKRGDTIALMGTTGDSTGNHCHFEVHPNGYGSQVDPMPYLGPQP